jgi:uncharacterized protein (TIGR03067 family)
MKKTLVLVLCVALTGALVLAWAQNVAKPDPSDEKLQGTWKVVAAEVEGMPVPSQKLGNVKVTFAKGTYTFQADGQTQKHEYKLDSSKSPKHIDLIQRKELLNKDSTKELRIEIRAGIFELNGDELKLCYEEEDAKKRPAEFKSKKDTGIFYLQLRRMK